MKTKMILATLCTLLLLLGGIGCEDDNDSSFCNCESAGKFSNIENLLGVVSYNEKIERWVINYSEVGSYDNFIVLVPCVLNEKYKRNDTHIEFSGKAFDSSVNFNVPAGGKFMCLKISSIKIIK